MCVFFCLLIDTYVQLQVELAMILLSLQVRRQSIDDSGQLIDGWIGEREELLYMLSIDRYN